MASSASHGDPHVGPWSAGVHLTLAACVIALVLLANVPSPLDLALNSDWAMQLAGGQQLLHGGAPFRDYPSTYGPLVYVSSSLVQAVFGNRFLGEFLLVVVGYGIGYLVLFHLAWGAGQGRPWVAWSVLLLGLLTLPRMYKYYIVLWPALSLLAVTRYIDRPTGRRLGAMALVTGVAGLYRPDLGAYSFLVSLGAVLVASGGPLKRRLVTAGALTAMVLGVAMPWLLWLASQDALGAYFYDEMIRMPAFAAGMALPFPDPELRLLSYDNFHLLSVFLAFLLPASAAAAALFCRGMETATRWKLGAAAVWAQLLLMQSLHRVSYSHFKQGFSLSLILLAALLGLAAPHLRGGSAVWRVRASQAVVAVFALLFLLSAAMNRPTSFSRRPWRYLAEHSRPAPQVLADLAANTDNADVLAMERVRACTDADDRVVAGPSLIGVYYLAERLFQSRHLISYPGLLTPEDEEVILDSYRREGPPAVFLYEEGYRLDEMEERRPDNYLLQLYPFLRERYTDVASFGAIRVAVPAEVAAGSPCALPTGLDSREVSGE